VSICYTGQTPSYSVCLCRVVLPAWVLGRVWPCTTEISCRQPAGCGRCFPKYFSTRYLDIWQGKFRPKNSQGRVVFSVGPSSGGRDFTELSSGRVKRYQR